MAEDRNNYINIRVGEVTPYLAYLYARTEEGGKGGTLSGLGRISMKSTPFVSVSFCIYLPNDIVMLSKKTLVEH